MSYTTGTTHYNLPQTVGTDKRDWSDTNQAFQDVDAALYGAVQDVAQAASDVDALESRMDTAEQNIATNTGDIAGLDTRVTTVEGAVTSLSGQVTDTRQDLEDMICAYNEASATSTHAYAIGDYFIYNDVLYKATQTIAIGDTIVPDTNCATTNVSTELLSVNAATKPALVSQILTDGTKTWGDVLTALTSSLSESTIKEWIANNKILYINRITADGAQANLMESKAYGIGSDGFFGNFELSHSYSASYIDLYNAGVTNGGVPFFKNVRINYSDPLNVTYTITDYVNSVLSSNVLHQLLVK